MVNKLDKRKKILISIIFIIIIILFILLILKNSIFYDYEKSINDALGKYPETKDITIINNLLERYQHNEANTNKINNLILDNIKKWIDNFNKDYNDKDELEASYNNIKELIKEFTSNTLDKVSGTYEKEYNDLIERLYLSKEAYLEGFSYYQNNDYENAYTKFNEVIKIDSSYNLLPPLIDSCIDNYLNSILKELSPYEEELETTLDKEATLKNILSILYKYQNNSKFDLSLSETFKNKESNYINLLKDEYHEALKELIDSEKYEEANTYLEEIKEYFKEYNIDTTDFKEEEDKIIEYLPVSLKTLTPKVSGWWNLDTEEILDKNRNKISDPIILRKGPYKELDTNTLIYNLDKKYSYLTFDIISLSNYVKDKTNAYLKIYTDNKLVYTLDYFTYNSDSITKTIDLKNISELKIEAYYNIDNKNESEYIDFLVIGNTKLGKS